MSKKTTIALSQYLTLVNNGYDGDVIRKWTRAHARSEIEKKRLGRHLSPPGKQRNLKPCPPPERFTVADALAAGLDDISAARLVTAAGKYGSGKAVRLAKDLPKEERDRMRDLCLDVISVVGLGVVDKAVLNHYIRDVLRTLLDRSSATTDVSGSLCRVFANTRFIEQAIDVLNVHVEDRRRSARGSSTRVILAESITRRWIEDGGWRAYWFAIDVIRAVYPHFRSAAIGAETLETALARAYGYANLSESAKATKQKRVRH